MSSTGLIHALSAHTDLIRQRCSGRGTSCRRRSGPIWISIRSEYEAIIHAELRLVRQKASLARAGTEAVAQTRSAASFEHIDWLKFAEKFRGTEEYVKRHLPMYAERFTGASNVIDIGCGRGELLEVLRAAGIQATGIDLNQECVATCRSKGLAVEYADLFEYLRGQPDASIGGIACLQVVEHLPPERLPEFVALAHAKLKQGAWLAMETPNPESLAIFARHFYLDPTHAKPVPPPLLAFYLEEAGFGRLDDSAPGTGHREHAGAGKPSPRLPRAVFRQPRLRHVRPEALAPLALIIRIRRMMRQRNRMLPQLRHHHLHRFLQLRVVALAD